MDNNAYKVFSTNKDINNPIDHISDMDIRQYTKDFLVVCYNYLLPNSYKKVLNNAAKNGFRQLLLSPYKSVKLVEILVSSNFQIKKIDFDPSVDEESIEIINNLLRERSISKLISDLDKEINYIDEEFDAIPSKITFSKGGYDYSIYNNGVFFVEEDNLISELNDVFSTLLSEKGGTLTC